MRERVASLGVALLMLSACSGADVLNALSSRRGVEIHKDIAYGTGPRQQLDIYRPSPKLGEVDHAPVVVFFYGGGWTAGDRKIYRFLGNAMAKRGVVVVVPDYRLYPDVKFAGFMEDAAASVAWTKRHVASFGGNPKRIFLMGHSAGGQIGAMLALNDEYLKAAGASPDELAGFIGVAGAYDFLPLTNPTYKTIFGPEGKWPLSQPVTFVTDEAPPMLLQVAEGDKTVLPRNSERLAARLRAVGRPVELKSYSGVGHITIVGAFSGMLDFLAPVRDDALAFIAATPAP